MSRATPAPAPRSWTCDRSWASLREHVVVADDGRLSGLRRRDAARGDAALERPEGVERGHRGGPRLDRGKVHEGAVGQPEDETARARRRACLELAEHRAGQALVLLGLLRFRLIAHHGPFHGSGSLPAMRTLRRRRAAKGFPQGELFFGRRILRAGPGVLAMMATGGTDMDADGTPARAELDRLLGALRPKLHRYCARMTGSVIDGEDVVQEAFVKALQAFPATASVSHLEAWLFRIAHNAALDFLRRRARREATHADEDPDMMIDPAALDPLAAAASLRTFMRLPVAQRSAVILMDVLGCPLEEIGEATYSELSACKAARPRARPRT